ncbi:Cysteine desulfurase [Pseudonocardia sp. Ae717_Ps2]|uniref:aminotransferase class V-fold PLP-dependent enzyme n=1 Tax=Pseudonocardia sp. Ae717_Ps2 TaxID=1885573 RepID=UPI00096525CC|nr:aminotransferase class V-fold PLP-dependent enzyme [Pseudonocardia sp. Ae717_Ps2]OLM30084.1 Cysteine desulfurase [Pseudonocardia sp. Ae717_Ps2]
MSPESIAGPAPRPALGTAPAPGIDVAAERARTPGVTESHHLNAAGAALPTAAVVDTVVEHLRREERDGGYEAAAAVGEAVEAVYDDVAELVGARAAEIALFDTATTGLRVLVDALVSSGTPRLLVSRSAYVSHALHLMAHARRTGTGLEILPVDPATGAVDLDALALSLHGGGPAIVFVAHLPTSSGLVEPVAALGALTRRHGARLVVDATQSVGHLPVDVGEIGCDVLVTTGRKFLRAPRGTAFAWVHPAVLPTLEPGAPDVRGAAWTAEREWTLAGTTRRFETWEHSVACRLGLGVAVRETVERGLDVTTAHLVALGADLREQLRSRPGVTVRDPAASTSGMVTFTVDGVEPAEVKHRLAAARVRVVTVPASHGQWDLGAREVPAVVRASVHVYNNTDDLDALLSVVDTITAGHR